MIVNERCDSTALVFVETCRGPACSCLSGREACLPLAFERAGNRRRTDVRPRLKRGLPVELRGHARQTARRSSQRPFRPPRRTRASHCERLRRGSAHTRPGRRCSRAAGGLSSYCARLQGRALSHGAAPPGSHDSRRRHPEASRGAGGSSAPGHVARSGRGDVP
jgi:hypothetical protein